MLLDPDDRLAEVQPGGLAGPAGSWRRWRSRPRCRSAPPGRSTRAALPNQAASSAANSSSVTKSLASGRSLARSFRCVGLRLLGMAGEVEPWWWVVPGGTSERPAAIALLRARLDLHVVGRVGGEQVDGRAVEQAVEVRGAAGVAAEQPVVAEEPEVARLGGRLVGRLGDVVGVGQARRVVAGGASAASIAASASESTDTSASSARSFRRRSPAIAASGSRLARTSASSSGSRGRRRGPGRSARRGDSASATRRWPSTTWPVRWLTRRWATADLVEDAGERLRAAPSDGSASSTGWRAAGRAPPRRSPRSVALARDAADAAGLGTSRLSHRRLSAGQPRHRTAVREAEQKDCVGGPRVRCSAVSANVEVTARLAQLVRALV